MLRACQVLANTLNNVLVKLIDKYIAKTVLTALVYVLSAFIMFFIIMDLFENLGDFLDNETPPHLIVQYYIFLVPATLVYNAPISMLLAVLYGLYNLTHSNELTAMRASGISLFRTICPILIIGTFLSIFVLIVNEAVGPSSRYFGYLFLSEQTGKANEEMSSHIGYGVPFRNGVEKRSWQIDEFNSKTLEMKGVVLTQEHENGFNLWKIEAKTAQWLDGVWWFYDISKQSYSKKGHPTGFPKITRKQEMLDLNETPYDFLNIIKKPEFLSAYQLKKYIQNSEGISDKKFARLNTDFHFRLALPFACIIVTLLGVPFGYTTARKGVLLGMIICFSLVFSYFCLVNLFLAMGKFQSMSSVLAGWLPNILFLGLGIELIRRMR